MNLDNLVTHSSRLNLGVFLCAPAASLTTNRVFTVRNVGTIFAFLTFDHFLQIYLIYGALTTKKFRLKNLIVTRRNFSPALLGAHQVV